VCACVRVCVLSRALLLMELFHATSCWGADGGGGGGKVEEVEEVEGRSSGTQ